MLVFPQLITGGSGLYPIRKTIVQRTVVNTLDDGNTDVYIDAHGALTVWELAGPGLTRAEWDAIEIFFEETAGMQNTFTLLDPVGNLLVQSETLSDPAWTADSSVHLTAGIGDPLGTTRATQVANTGATLLQIGQTLPVPGNYQYCFSAWMRADVASNVTLVINAGVGGVQQAASLNSQWQRVYAAGNPGEAAVSSVTFQLLLAAGATVDIFGLQAEAQLAPSDYKITGRKGGVYAKARFAGNQITGLARSVDVHDSIIRIVSTEN